jgi:hypothetical protein
MHAFHFGAGYFGLGFSCALLHEAGVPLLLLNRKTRQHERDGLDTVSRARRNELLQRNSMYFVSHRDMRNPSASDFQQVSPEGVLLYDSANADEIADTLAEYDDDLIVTFALRRIENYESAINILVRIGEARERRKSRGVMYLMACENGVETSKVALEFNRTASRLGVTLNQERLHFLDTSVDRICTKLTSWRPASDLRDHTDAEYLVVEAERHARWYIEDTPGLDDLKWALAPLGTKVIFTKYVAQERLKKLAVINGTHALLGLHCWYLAVEKTDEFLYEISFRDKTGKTLAIEPVERRCQFLASIVGELFDGTRLFLAKKDDVGRTFCDLYMTDIARDKLMAELVDRLSRTPDSVVRIIKNFVRPEPEDRIQERHMEFFRSVRARVEEPVLSYIEHHHSAPPMICRVLVEILDLLGRVDQFRNMPLYYADHNLN